MAEINTYPQPYCVEIRACQKGTFVGVDSFTSRCEIIFTKNEMFKGYRWFCDLMGKNDVLVGFGEDGQDIPVEVVKDFIGMVRVIMGSSVKFE